MKATIEIRLWEGSWASISRVGHVPAPYQCKPESGITMHLPCYLEKDRPVR